MSVVQTEVHDVVEDHDVADVIQVVIQVENDGDYFNQEVTLSEEENEEDNLQYQQHNVEDDVRGQGCEGEDRGEIPLIRHPNLHYGVGQAGPQQGRPSQPRPTWSRWTDSSLSS